MKENTLRLPIPTNFLPKLVAFLSVTAFGVLFALNRELEWFFRIPLTVFCAGGTVAMAMSLEECRYRFTLTEEGIEISLCGKRTALAPWETVHWRLAENIPAPQNHLHELNGESCILAFRWDGMENPRYLFRNSEEYRLGRVDFYTVQAFLVCCPNLPERNDEVAEELVRLDASRLRETSGLSDPSHRFAAAVYQKKVMQK